MKVSFQRWMVYTIRQNIRALIVVFCGFCIVVPLSMFYTMTPFKLRELILFVCTFFSIMTAIYLFRFLYHPGAAALQLSMPIERRRLWCYHWFVGCILVNLMVIFYTWFACGLELKLFLCGWLIGAFFENTVYAITVFLVSRCRRMMDAVLIGFGWLILLALLRISFEAFVNSRSSYLIQAYSYDGIITNEMYYYLCLVSLPHLGSYLFWDFFDLISDIWQYLPLMIYWLVIAVVMTVWTIWNCPKIQGETCGVYTDSHVVYPFAILVTTLSLLNCIEWNEWTPFFYMMIFLIFSAMYFIYKRSVRFTGHMLIGFAILSVFEVSASFFFVNTHGLGSVEEVISKDSFEQMTIEMSLDQTMYVDEENMDLIKKVLEKNKITIDANSTLDQLIICMDNDSELIDDIQNIQKEIMNTVNKEQTNYVLRLQYWYDIDYMHQRYFCYVGNQKQMNQYYHEILELLMKKEGEYSLNYFVTTIMEKDSPNVDDGNGGEANV